MTDTKICTSCGEEKDLSKFKPRKSLKSGIIYSGQCYICIRAREKLRRETEEGIAAYRRDQRRRAERKKIKRQERKEQGIIGFIKNNIARWRKKTRVHMNMESNLTEEYLVDLFNKQDSKCYYTGVTLSTDVKKSVPMRNGRHAEYPSLEKLIPDNGYVIGNVVWASLPVNSMKGNLNEEDFITICGLISAYAKK